MTRLEEVKYFIHNGQPRLKVEVLLPGGQNGTVVLEGIPRNVTDALGNFFPDESDEHLWLTGTFDYFLRLSDIVRIDRAE